MLFPTLRYIFVLLCQYSGPTFDLGAIKSVNSRPQLERIPEMDSFWYLEEEG